MSETDDTEVLLLVPPGLLLPASSGEEAPSPARALRQLEARVCELELGARSDAPAAHTRYYSTENNLTFPRKRKRKTTSTILKNRLSAAWRGASSSSEEDLSRLKHSISAPTLTSDTQENKINNSFTMDGDISSIVSTPSKTNDKLLLNEIDEFLTRIQSYESPDTKFKASHTTETSKNVIEATRNYLSQKLDSQASDHITLPSGRTVPNEFFAKYIYLTKGLQLNEASSSSGQQKDKAELENTSAKDVTPKNSQQDIKKVEEKNTSVRKLNFDSSNVQPTSTPLKRGNTLPKMDSFRPSSNKIYEKASKVLEQYKTSMLSCDTSYSSYLSPQKNDFRSRRRYNQEQKTLSSEMYQRSKAQTESKYPHSIDTDLLSLSELWCEREGQGSGHGKLEEERLKREHCENVIHELQKKILEQQERLAVAVRVDRAKDNAISRLRDAWVRVTSGLEETEAKHKIMLEKVTAEMTMLKESAEEAQKKTQHFESEMYKTLDLAHDYQEKCKVATGERQRLEARVEQTLAESEERLRERETEIAREREQHEAVARHNQQLAECVRNTEEGLMKERSEHIATKNKLSEANKLTQSYQEELTLLQQERDLLKEKVKEERSRCLLLEKQLGDANSKLTDAQKRESTLDNEVKSIRKHLELQKNELKSHYQKQLEDAVLAKLKEFQQQLDVCEREMERDARERESGIVDSCNKRIQRIEEQHKLEVNVLEEKQKEEIKLCRLQLVQASEKMGALESKLEGYRRRRGQIASQLHRVMESQWRQALQILSSGAQSASTDTSAHHHNTSHENYHQSSPPIFLTQNLKSQSAPAFNGQVARPAHNPTVYDDRLSVDNLSTDGKYNIDGLSDTEIQHYVKMLLMKPPDFLDGSGDTGALASLDESQVQCHSQEHEEPTSDRPEPHKHKDKPGKRLLNLSKPPWKA